MSTQSQENCLPEDLSNLSFEEIFEIKNKMGMKAFNTVLTGTGSQKDESKRVFHRENKNRPREISSKIRPSSLHHSHRGKKTAPISERKPVDPRFSHSCGEFNRQMFDENYKFLKKVRRKERRMLTNELSNPEINEEEQKRIKLLLQRMDNQNKEKGKLKKKSKLEQVEKEYQINELKEGRLPKYHRKSEKKLFDLVSQFEELKEKGGLIKHIKRRRKKLNQKDCKHFDFLNTSE